MRRARTGFRTGSARGSSRGATRAAISDRATRWCSEYQPYDPAGAAGAPERFYFGLGSGWYEWERAGFRDFFNRVGGFNTAMDRSVWCQGP
jgi:hypothetical protein